MASSTSTPTPPDVPLEDEDNAADLPMTMAASVILEHLPKDAHAALETAGELKDANGEVKGKGTANLWLPTTTDLDSFSLSYEHF